MGQRGMPELVDDERSATRRLSNIRPHEVSLVDTAANGRQFLIVKRKGDDMKPKDKSLFANVLKTNTKAVAKAEGGEGEGAADPAATATPPAEGAAPAAAAAPAAVAKKEGEQPPAAAAEPAAAEPAAAQPGVVEKFAAIFKGLKKKSEDDKVDIKKAVADEQFMMFAAMADALDWLTDTVKMISSDLKTFVDSGGKTGFMGEEVVKSLGGPEAAKMILEEGMTDEMFEKMLVVVQKKGAKMKSARLEKFRGLVGGLMDLLKDLEGEAAPAAVVEKSMKAEDVKAIVTEEVTKALAAQKAENDTVVKSLTDKIAKLEAAPVAPAGEGSNGTEEPAVTTTNKNQGKKSIWAGVI